MGHRIHHDLYLGPKTLDDPGDGNDIRATEDLSICEMVSTGTETRTLLAPTKPGIRLTIRMYTDGGDIVVTAAEGFNRDLETDATFADAGDILSLISVTLARASSTSAPTYRWEILEGNVGVSLA